jgi:hypothetical protein
MIPALITILKNDRWGAFSKQIYKQIYSVQKRGFFPKKFVAPQAREKFTFKDML